MIKYLYYTLTLCIAVSANGRPGRIWHEPITGDRIINGEPAEVGQFPHMVFLLPAGCGGSIISDKWVLTAAHCVESNGIVLYMGGVKLKQMTTAYIPAQNIHIHPRWNNLDGIMDIALLELEEALTFTDKVKPIRVANSKDDLFVGEEAVLSGFGYINDQLELPKILQYANLTVITNEDCQSQYNPMTIHDTDLCALGTDTPPQNSCFGDSGSGLILNRPEGAVLIGITSFGKSYHCEDPYPTGFVRPNYFLDWIRNTTGLDI